MPEWCKTVVCCMLSDVRFILHRHRRSIGKRKNLTGGFGKTEKTDVIFLQIWRHILLEMTSYFCIFVRESLKVCQPTRKSPSPWRTVKHQNWGAKLKTKQTMANRPLAYTLTERKATIGAASGTPHRAQTHRPSQFLWRGGTRNDIHRCRSGSRTATCRRNCETTCGKRRHRRVWRHRHAHTIFPEQNRGEG